MEITNAEKYEYLIEELKAILVEGVYDANMRLIETYHHFGVRLAIEIDSNIYGDSLTEKVARDIGKSQRTIQKCVQFARKYPQLEEFLSVVEEGKAITWNRIANHYLVEPKELPEPEPLPNFSMDKIESYLTSDLEFLVKTAEVTKDGIHFFLPKDRYSNE